MVSVSKNSSGFFFSSIENIYYSSGSHSYLISILRSIIKYKRLRSSPSELHDDNSSSLFMVLRCSSNQCVTLLSSTVSSITRSTFETSSINPGYIEELLLMRLRKHGQIYGHLCTGRYRPYVRSLANDDGQMDSSASKIRLSCCPTIPSLSNMNVIVIYDGGYTPIFRLTVSYIV